MSVDGRDGVAANLLRRRVVGRHHARSDLRERPIVGCLLAEHLRDAEVEELHGAVGRYQDVRRLEVAVDDEILMGVADGVADRAEQAKPLVDRQAMARRSAR